MVGGGAVRAALVGLLVGSAVWLAGRWALPEAPLRSAMRGGGPVAASDERADGRALGAIRAGLARALGARRAAERRIGHLADALATVASGMRTGLSLVQAIEVAAEGSPDPLGAELRTVVDRVRLGVPLEQAVARWAEAIPSPEVRLAVGVLRMHRTVGGAVAPALENLSRTLRERGAAARELRSLTAQARLSGAVLGLLPIGFFAFLSVAARRDVVLALHTPLGRGAVIVGLVLDTLAFAWIRRMLRVDG